MKPWRAVVGDPRWYAGRGSTLGRDTARRNRWWRLQLACGHTVERTVRYCSLGKEASRGGTQYRDGADVLPAPKRVRCEFCR